MAVIFKKNGQSISTNDLNRIVCKTLELPITTRYSGYLPRTDFVDGIVGDCEFATQMNWYTNITFYAEQGMKNFDDIRQDYCIFFDCELSELDNYIANRLKVYSEFEKQGITFELY